MKKCLLFACLLAAGVLIFAAGCSKSDAPAPDTSSAGDPMKDLIRNFTDGYNTNDAAKVAACFSKRYREVRAQEIRKEQSTIAKYGLTPNDLNLSDEALFEKTLSIKIHLEKKVNNVSQNVDFKIKEMKETIFKEEPSMLRIMNNSGVEDRVNIYKENGVWKLEGENIFKLCFFNAPEQEAAKSAGAATPEELVQNFSDAMGKKDCPAVVACFSKESTAKNIKFIREDAAKNPQKLVIAGLTADDFKLSDEKLLEKILAKNFERGNEDTLSALKLTVVNKNIAGDKGTVNVKGKDGRSQKFTIVKEGGFWKIEEIGSGEAEIVGARASLMNIRTAEAIYKARYQTYGTLTDLAASDMLSDAALASGKKYGYAFTVEAEKYKFTAVAAPEDAGQDAYRMTETGVLEIKRPGDGDFSEFKD
jgi:hypothetical protein